MSWLNYQHLFYFWVIAREGSLSRAASSLHLTHSTLSVQLRALEDALGEPLFERRGRALALTPFGREVQAYAGDIFRLGSELLDFARGRAVSLRRFEVGVVGALPKTIVTRMLMPALDTGHAGALRLRQDSMDRLVPELVAGRLHAILSDAAPVQASVMRLHTHPLGASEIMLYGAPALAERFVRGFPRSLDEAPVLMPGPDAALRRGLERWFADRAVRPHVVGEIDDAGMLRALGAAGHGLFPVRAALRGEVEERLGARRVGHLAGLVEPYFVISLERRVKNPAVAALIDEARRRLGSEAAPAAATAVRSPRRGSRRR